MQVVLVMFRGEGGRRSFSLARDVSIIGRREDCDFRIPLSEISRRHCRLIRDGDALRIEDMGSSNGTFVNGTRVQEAVLQPGDTLHIGSITFVVQVDGVPAEEEMRPMPMGAATAPTEATEAAEPEHAGTNGQSTDQPDELGSEQGIEMLNRGDDSEGTTGAAESGPTGEEVFDPMAILGEKEDSAHAAELDGSQLGQDALGDLERSRTNPKKS
jgi:pSer/pThr/pTyr-binding forkhead associated (FHA) protein